MVYFRCSGDHQTLMVNEVLSEKNNSDAFAKHQVRHVLKFVTTSGERLLDFGCGTGNFLLEAQKKFIRAGGVEITLESRQIAEKRGLEVSTTIPPNGFDVITFWHSLEHLPFKTLKETLLIIEESEVGRVHVSIPNAKSITTMLFGDYDAYNDEENHTFIFSQKILKEIFDEIGFTLVDSRTLFSYTMFGTLQSSINFVTRTRNQLYYILKRGAPANSLSAMRHIFLMPAFISLALVVSLISVLFPSRDPVLNLTFSRTEGTDFHRERGR